MLKTKENLIFRPEEERSVGMRKLNEIITRISVWILKKIRWENTEFNQQTISTILGWTFGFILACIYKFILA